MTDEELKEYDVTQSEIYDNKTLRTRKTAKHLLAAIVFNESSTVFMEKTEGTLLACIGYYYVGFHTALAMLSLCPLITSEDLTEVHHKQLKKLVEQHLIQSKQIKITRKFLDDYQKLQDFREYANYNFGSKFPKFNYPLIYPEIKDAANNMLTIGKDYIIKQLAELRISLGDLQAIIGDDIGSDLIRLHSGKVVDERVWDYLIKNNLTT
jgi:hypothetical protein